MMVQENLHPTRKRSLIAIAIHGVVSFVEIFLEGARPQGAPVACRLLLTPRKCYCLSQVRDFLLDPIRAFL